MSTQELAPLFPTPTHPAIPISAQILSRLRHLTGPGKGNDLKPEERAALVGVAAVLGCEKIQSKDLPEESARKACSVSGPHFRHTLALCRKILASSASSPGVSPSRPRERSSRSSPAGSSVSPSRSASGSASGSASAQSPRVTTTEQVLSSLQTPKKKIKYTSNVDTSGLLRTPASRHKSAHGNEHEPARGSPLRQSVTRVPSGVPPPPGLGEEAGEGEGEGEETPSKAGRGEARVGAGEVDKTPTKKNKFSSTGIDLEHPPPPSVLNSRRKKESASAFLALRPGGSPSNSSPDAAAGINGSKRGRGVDTEDGDVGEGWLRRPREEGRKRARNGEGAGERKVKRKKADWTFKESGEWGAGGDRDGASLDQILDELPGWLETKKKAAVEAEVVGEDVAEAEEA
ncbi:hypothetical protein IAT38_005153 [Cryptococcus sp. DSM 104549]